jgi:hypothetical protein
MAKKISPPYPSRMDRAYIATLKEHQEIPPPSPTLLSKNPTSPACVPIKVYHRELDTSPVLVTTAYFTERPKLGERVVVSRPEGGPAFHGLIGRLKDDTIEAFDLKDYL